MIKVARTLTLKYQGFFYQELLSHSLLNFFLLTFGDLKNFVLLYFLIPDSGFWIPDSAFRILDFRFRFPGFRVAPLMMCQSARLPAVVADLYYLLLSV